MTKLSNEEKHHDFIVVGAGAAGSVLAAESSASGAQVLVIESGGPDDAPTILNPSIWFYNVAGPLDYHLPITPCHDCSWLRRREVDRGTGRRPHCLSLFNSVTAFLRSTGGPIGGTIEEAAGTQGRVAAEPVCVAMETVGPTSSYNVDNRARITAVFGVEGVRDDAELFRSAKHNLTRGRLRSA